MGIIIFLSLLNSSPIMYTVYCQSRLLNELFNDKSIGNFVYSVRMVTCYRRWNADILYSQEQFVLKHAPIDRKLATYWWSNSSVVESIQGLLSWIRFFAEFILRFTWSSFFHRNSSPKRSFILINCILYCSPYIARDIKCKRRWVGHVAIMEEARSVFKFLTGTPKGKRPLGRTRRGREDNIRMDIITRN